MRRDLPPRASLEHLKKQAKDLLDGHKRADPEALARIRDAVPSFSGMTTDAIGLAPFALHDAQSAIAREYGVKSWSELRDAAHTINVSLHEMAAEFLAGGERALKVHASAAFQFAEGGAPKRF